ncbi:MAG: hypothetical protein N3B13_05095 [Deltaproteobacteria bacterium]|nr:hypothetical protein [Deltaproteobacteria bacterium]
MKNATFLIIFACFLYSSVIFAQVAEKPAGTADEMRSTEAASAVQKEAESAPQPSDNAAKQPSTGPVSEMNDSTDKKQEGEKQSKIYDYKSYNSFGISISSHSGIGLSYRYHLDSPLLFQITGGVISEGESYFYAVGAEIQRELSKSKDKRAFGSFAAGIYGERDKEVYDVGYSTGMNPPEKWTSSNAYAFAVGVGGELALGNSIVDTLTIGCEIYPVGIYFTDSGDSGFNMFPGASVYIYYNF